MQTEYEATFSNINKDEVRQRVKAAGAKLIHAERLMRRTVFTPPRRENIEDSWLRVRDEGDKTTMSLKVVSGHSIEDQKESYLEVNDYDAAVDFLKSIGCQQKAYHETKREMWDLDGVDICIDEWPFLEPFVEVEGKDEAAVRAVSEKIGFNYQKAIFCAVDYQYSQKYGLSEHEINNNTPKIAFEMENPFINR
jgi:adenylate cyclase class 2